MKTEKRGFTAKDAMWIDESGMAIPFKRITPFERKREASAEQLLAGAIKINKQLIEFHAKLRELSAAVYEEFMKENKCKPTKGNFTWYNFNRTIRIEVSISDRIEFDDLGIQACKQKLDEYLDQTVETKEDFVINIIQDAFSTTRGKLDTKKVQNLLRYKSRVKNALFQEAMEHLESAIRKPSSKTYFRIGVKEEDGSYTNVDLNLSNID